MSALWYRKPICMAGLCCTYRFASDEHGCWGECSICHKRVGYVDRATLRLAADAEAAQNELMAATDSCCCEWCGEDFSPEKMATAELCEECIHVADLEDDAS